MDIIEITETIKKHITIIKKIIIKPLGFDVVVAVPKKNGKKTEKTQQNE